MTSIKGEKYIKTAYYAHVFNIETVGKYNDLDKSFDLWLNSIKGVNDVVKDIQLTSSFTSGGLKVIYTITIDHYDS